MHFRRFGSTSGLRLNVRETTLRRSALLAASVMLSANVYALPTPFQPMTFSVDAQGPTAAGGFGNFPEAFILTPATCPSPGPCTPGAPPPPQTSIPQGPVIGELDALSYGNDPLDVPSGNCNGQPCFHVFSVDEFAIGLPGSAVRTEGALGNQQASADTFITPKLPLPTPPLPGTNASFTDGDGIAPSGAPGVGLIEPNPPTTGSGGEFVFGQIDPGDNLDALDFDTTADELEGPVFISLDSAFGDPLEGGPVPNYATAATGNAGGSFVGGDVLVWNPDPAPGIRLAPYALAPLLGLDLLGPDTDDLDALKLAENGIADYQPSIVPFDWLTGATDMLLYSVRRGSSIIGLNLVDSIFGIPIEEGDILTTPCPAGAVLPDGTVCVGGGTPGIFVSAEALGLATVRSGTGATWGVANLQWGGQDIWADDLDAYDQKVPEPGTLALLIAGFGGLAGMGARRRRKG